MALFCSIFNFRKPIPSLLVSLLAGHLRPRLPVCLSVRLSFE
uniref:Uncharacterized protein n=1 Tax=Anguilla anguilla TaxID=7936 RepID=A0A0E9U887_ANGAN